MLSMTYWFDEVCFESETNGFCNNNVLTVERFNVVYDRQIRDHRYWFEEVRFEIETNGFCNNHFLIVKRLSVVHDSQNLGTPALIWRGLLLIWNQQYLQQPFSNGGTSQCCPWQPKPRIIGTDLKSPASNLKLFLQQPFSYGETSQRCPWHKSLGSSVFIWRNLLRN